MNSYIIAAVLFSPQLNINIIYSRPLMPTMLIGYARVGALLMNEARLVPQQPRLLDWRMPRHGESTSQPSQIRSHCLR